MKKKWPWLTLVSLSILIWPLSFFEHEVTVGVGVITTQIGVYPETDLPYYLFAIYSICALLFGILALFISLIMQIVSRVLSLSTLHSRQCALVFSLCFCFGGIIESLVVWISSSDPFSQETIWQFFPDWLWEWLPGVVAGIGMWCFALWDSNRQA